MNDTLALPERVTLDNATAVMAVLQDQLPKGQLVHLNAHALQTFDSAVVAVLLALQRRLLGENRRLQVSQRSERLQALLVLYGVADLLPA